MALSFEQQVQLAADTAFAGRVRQAMITTAVLVMGMTPKPDEDDAQERHRRRTRYAVEVLRNPDVMAQGMIKAAVTIEGASPNNTDAQITAGIRSLWDAFSEVVL